MFFRGVFVSFLSLPFSLCDIRNLPVFKSVGSCVGGLRPAAELSLPVFALSPSSELHGWTVLLEKEESKQAGQ